MWNNSAAFELTESCTWDIFLKLDNETEFVQASRSNGIHLASV